MEKVVIIGDGGWGTALAILLHNKGVDVTLWSVSPEYAEYLDKKRENVKFLKGISLPDSLRITSDILLVKSSVYAFFAVPCEYLRSIAERFSNAGFSYIISAAKGIEQLSLKRPSEILSEFFTKTRIGVLSGPNISYEVARNIPTTTLIAAKGEWNKKVQDLMMTKNFRVYTSSDMIGVEVGGALKNIIAIAAGISDGLGFGTNSKAAILARGLAEITRLGVSMGAQRETFSGLSGIGDLTTTCISPYSRNRWFGEEIGKGRKPKEILDSTEKVVEGVSTCLSAQRLAKKYRVEMPITEEVYEIIYNGKNPADAVRKLMMRRAKDE